MTYKTQFPPYISRAMEIAGLHMAYQLANTHLQPGWCTRLRPTPMNVQAPEPSLSQVGQKMRTAVCVTLRYPRQWQVKVHLVMIGDGRADWQWKLVRLDSIFPLCESVRKHTCEGAELFRKMVEFYGLPVDMLEHEVRACKPARMTAGGMQTVLYRFPDGSERVHTYHWDLFAEDGEIRRRAISPHGLEDLVWHDQVARL